MYKHANQELRRHQSEVEEVKRGLRAPPVPEKKTVGDALDYWRENRAPQKRSRGDDESILRRHLRPVFGHLLLRELGVQHTDTYLAQRAAVNPKTVNNHLTLFISVLNAAVDLGWLAKVPRIKKALSVPPLPLARHRRRDRARARGAHSGDERAVCLRSHAFAHTQQHARASCSRPAS
jgi:hypothetical protein